MLRGLTAALAGAAIVGTCGASGVTSTAQQRAHFPSGSFARSVSDAKWAGVEKAGAARTHVSLMNHSCGVQEAKSL